MCEAERTDGNAETQLEMLRWLEDLTERDAAVVGPKVARLQTLRRLGIEVPDGFAVTTEAFRAFLSENSLEPLIDRELAAVTDADDLASLETAAARLRDAIERAPLDVGFATQLKDAYDELCFRYGDIELPVAVRSSAVGEDAAVASFAGQYESYLGITGTEAVLAAVRRAWSSLFVARALSYRLRQRQHYRDTPMAVGVLRLVHARCAGVGFSADPVRNKLDRFVVEGSWGWGEAIVQGTVEPDHVEIDRADGRVISYRVGDKRIATLFDRALGVVADKELPVRFHTARCLSDEMIKALWQALTQIERHFGHPVDIEWVIEPNWRPGIPVSVVQVRAITTLGNEAPASAPPRWDALGYAAKYGLGIKPKSAIGT
jgi:pyruvate, water dikinase